MLPRIRVMRFTVWLFAAVLAGPLRADDTSQADVEFFETKIRPVLVEHCYQCHSAAAQTNKKLKGGLLLDTRTGLRAGGETGRAVVPGEPGESLLLTALRGNGDASVMPPKGKLPDAVIANFETWIKSGAVDPRTGDSSEQSSTGDIDAARRQHWAFQPPRLRPLPPVKTSDWPLCDLDYFVLARLEHEQLRPVAPASGVDLIRRAYFDLIGLPPTPDEVDAFLNDASPNAFAKVVDQLLDSPHYGERWGRHWLDVARYAEDQALANARPNPYAFRYRDWVIQALNRDMPYDQFLRLQIAGDLLPEPVDDYFVRLAGLGFQGLGQLYHRGNFAEQVMADELDDRIDTLSRGLLGLTVACARCHDHKYDPIPTRDYYSLAAAYYKSNLTVVPVAPPAVVRKHAEFVQQVKQRETALAQWVSERGRQLTQERLQDLRKYLLTAWRIRAKRAHGKKVDEKVVATTQQLIPYFLTRWAKLLEAGDIGKSRKPLAAWHTAARAAATIPAAKAENPELPAELLKATDDLCVQAALLGAELRKIDEAYQQALAAAKEDDRKNVKRAALPGEWQPLFKALLQENDSPLRINGDDVTAFLNDAGRQEHERRKSELEEFRKSGPPVPPLAHAVSGGGVPMKIHMRGSVERKGDDAPPGFLQVLQKPRSSTPDDDQSEQKTSDTAKPATFTRLDLAKAIVDRDNPLTARVLVNRVWQHHFGSGIVATPSNFGRVGEPPSHPELLDHLAVAFMEDGWSMKWLHRQIMLSQTYRLASTQDAAGMEHDPENRLLWRFTPRRLDFEPWRDSVLAVSGRLDRTAGGPSQSLESSLRRTTYAAISRSRIDPTLAMFDFPDANVSSERRSVTMVAQQQLFVLNSPFMIEAGKAFAARIEAAATKDEARISIAYRLAFQRNPLEDELAIGQQFLATTSQTEADKLTPWQRYAQALLASNEFTWMR